MLNIRNSTFSTGSNFLNTSFIFVFSLIICIITGGRSIYVIPLLLSAFILFKNHAEIRLIKWKFDFYGVIFTASVFFFFFYHFVGFDLIGNEIHKDLIYYGALSDFLGSFHQETNYINIFNAINKESAWNFYHYFEIWISGFIGNAFQIPSIKVLLLFTYPIFCLISIHNLKSLLTTLNIEIKTNQLLMAVGLFFTILAWLPSIFQFLPILKSYITFNEFLTSGYIKLLIAIPLVIHSFNYFLTPNKTLLNHLLYFLVLFYYPVLIPFGIGCFVFFNFQLFVYRFIQPKYFFLILFLIILGLLPFFHTLLQPIKMDIVRMGIPSLLIIYIFFQKTKPNNTIHLYASILLFAVLMNLSFLIGQKLLPNISILKNIDLFQTWSNFTTILAFLIFLILIIFSLRSFDFKPKLLFSLTFIALPILISKAKPIHSYKKIDDHCLKTQKTHYFVIEDKLSNQKINQWTIDLVYMLINEKHSRYIWENNNFFLINNMEVSEADTGFQYKIYKNEIIFNQKFLKNKTFMESNHLKDKIMIPLNLR